MKYLEKRVSDLEMDHTMAQVYTQTVADDIAMRFEWITEDVISDELRVIIDKYLLRRFGDAAYTKNKLKGRKLIITFK